MTTHSWDEEPQGEWTLEIENTAASDRDYGNSALIVQSRHMISNTLVASLTGLLLTQSRFAHFSC